MTVLLLSQVFPPRTGGSGRWLWELYRRLQGINVHVLAADTEGAADFDRQAPFHIERLELDFPNWGLAHPGGGPHYVRRALEINRIARRVRPDVLHCAKCLPEGLLAMAIKRWRGLPFVVYAHGEELTLAATSAELSFLTRRVLRAAKQIIANSRHTRHLLNTKWAVADDRIVVLHPGVDTTVFVPAPPDEDVRKRLGWAGRRVVLTVGTLQKRKGQDMMIRSLPIIRSVCPDVLYAIMGQGWEQDYLEQLVDTCGVRDFVQFRGVPGDAELIRCYQQCDLFALPNRQVGWDIEGFGIVSIEAQSCGRPVVVGASGGTLETVQPSVTGEVVSCEQPQPLAAAVTALLQDPARRMVMGAAARQWVVDQFDWRMLGRQAAAMFMAG